MHLSMYRSSSEKIYIKSISNRSSFIVIEILNRNIIGRTLKITIYKNFIEKNLIQFSLEIDGNMLSP